MYQCKRCGWSGKVRGRPRCLACYRRRVKEWRAQNPEKAKAQRRRHDRRFRTERPEEYNARRRRKRARNSETAQRAWRRRVEWLLQGDVTRDQLISIWEVADGKCNYCGVKVRPRFNPLDPRGFDHVQSRAENGKHTADNLVVCCRSCNEAKG